MKELNLQVTDELMAEIEASAKFCLVTPEHYATCKLSQLFRKEPSKWAQWLPEAIPVLESLAGTLKNLLASQSKSSTVGEAEDFLRKSKDEPLS